MIAVRQSTAFETAIGPVLDANGVAVTDCVVGDFKIKKTSGNFAALNGSATLTHVSAGFYDLVLTTSDVDTVGVNVVAIDDTTNTCSPLYLQVVEEAVYDAVFAASAAGYQVPIWAAANSTVNLSATTIKTVTDTVGAQLADGVTHGGTTALLRLGSSSSTPALYVTNSGGNAFQLESTGGNGHAAYMLGNGTGEGIHSQGGASGDGIRGEAGATTGYGIVGVGNANGTHGIAGFGNGSGAGLYAQGGTGGAGGWFKGGSTAGPGVLMAATAGDDDGLRCEANGTGQDIDADISSNVQTAVGMASANLDTQLDALPTNAELATAIITGLTTALTEGYRGTNATGSVRDLLYEILQNITEFAISGTTKTVKKLDGSTTAKTYTLDDATTPTAITETT